MRNGLGHQATMRLETRDGWQTTNNYKTNDLSLRLRRTTCAKHTNLLCYFIKLSCCRIDFFESVR
jgi:hypothetical protein